MSDSSVEPHGARLWPLVVWIICAAGALVRIAAYIENRSLWYDEAALALNFARRGFLELLAPLDNLQAAPPFFLWLERTAVAVFGLNEWALRALPLAAGIATGPMMWRVARRMLPPALAVLPVTLVMFSPSLVRFAAEVKPYSLDALITLIVVDRAFAAAEPGARADTWWMLVAAGVVGMVSSTPAVLVLAGVIALFTVRAIQTRSAVIARRTVALGASWGLAGVLLLATIYRQLVGESSRIGKFMHWYWAENFLTPGPPGLATKVSAMVWAMLTNTFLGATAPPHATPLLIATLAVGLVMLLVTRRYANLALLVVPIAALAVASALRLYPIAERLVLFAAPLVALVLASSLLLVMHGERRRRFRWIGAVATIVLAVLGLRGDVAYLTSNEGRQETRALVQFAVRRHAQGEPVWVSGGAEPAWRFYSGQTESRAQSNETGPLSAANREIAPGVLVGAWYHSAPEHLLPTTASTSSVPSQWSETEAGRLRDQSNPCVLTFHSLVQPGETASLLSSAADAGGRVANSWRAPGAALYEICFATSADERS